LIRSPSWEFYGTDYPGAFGPDCATVKMPHRFLHTVGLLPCCGRVGCEKRRVVALPDRNHRYNGSLCKFPQMTPTQLVPRCMDLVTTDHAIEAVMSYYEDGVLS
jgi:hypothetical protein